MSIPLNEEEDYECKIKMKNAFSNEGTDLFLARTFVLLGPKDCFSLGSPQGEGSSPGLVSNRGQCPGTWDIPDDLGPHGQFAKSIPCRCALTAVLLATKNTRAKKKYPWIMSLRHLGKAIMTLHTLNKGFV